MKKEIAWLLKEKYHGKATVNFTKDIKRLEGGEPLDYVIGFTEFLGCKIDLSKKPLIPRPETEFWVDEAMSKLQRANSNNAKPFAVSHKPLAILDIFAGSGCIGLSIMRQIKNSHIVFAESEKSALWQIQKNCGLNKIPKNRYKIIRSDVFRGLNLKSKFNYILANPPYIPTIRKNKIQTSVLKYEPKRALLGGGDGLFYIRKFLASAKNFLHPGGKIYMEFDSIQKPQIEKLFKKYGYEKWEFHKDQHAMWRWVVVDK